MAVWIPWVGEAILGRLDDGILIWDGYGAGAGFHAAPATAILLLVLAPLVGRIFLAWFPPGLPGGRAPRELPATWAASYLVGLTWLTSTWTIVPVGARDHVVLGVPALALVARLLTLPAALVPRHEPVPGASSGVARFATLLAVLAVAGAGAGRESLAGDAVLAIALLPAAIFVHEALSIARVPHWIRAAVLALLALALATGAYSLDQDVFVFVATSAAAAGAVGWIRRGDRRALALAATAIALLASQGARGAPVAIGLAIALVLASARPSRRFAIAWASGGFAVGLITPFVRGFSGRRDEVQQSESVWMQLSFALPVVAAFVVAALVARRRDPPTWNPSGAPVGREAHVLASGALLAALLVAVGHALPSDWIRAHVGSTPFPALSIWLLLAIAAAIALSRALERRTRTS